MPYLHLIDEATGLLNNGKSTEQIGSIELGNSAFRIFLANQDSAFLIMLRIHFKQAALNPIPSVETILYYIGGFLIFVFSQFTYAFL